VENLSKAGNTPQLEAQFQGLNTARIGQIERATPLESAKSVENISTAICFLAKLYLRLFLFPRESQTLQTIK